ncbi:hypothetical protein PVK06_019078 [Gossypium arboreum]|uniref:RNase H type-1 domain-containing protein n=1 Tax=Gossypium arboreum TaxID=29729 RepID=A0ABR0PIS9_GOSAR|nr:hypothetical protein PVK06_019078 [Gossypium arboreum]
MLCGLSGVQGVTVKIFCMLSKTIVQVPRPIDQTLKNWIKLCTDGAVQVYSRKAAMRRVLRNGNEEWIMGYNRRYAGVIIQTDSLEVVKVIQESFQMNSNFALIRRIHNLLVNIGLEDLQYIPRDYNKIVDGMVEMAFYVNHSLKVFKKIPRKVLAISIVVQARDNLASSILV